MYGLVQQVSTIVGVASLDRARERVKTGVIRARRQLNDPAIYYYFGHFHNEM